jgi:hypothetical protein
MLALWVETRYVVVAVSKGIGRSLLNRLIPDAVAMRLYQIWDVKDAEQNPVEPPMVSYCRLRYDKALLKIELAK